MKAAPVLKVFGSAKGLADAIGISQQAVARWDGAVPRARVKSVQMALREKALELEALAREVKALAEGQ